MRELFGMGTPRGLVAFVDLALALYLASVALVRLIVGWWRDRNQPRQFLAAA